MTKISDIWETFCPLRGEVRAATEAGTDCDEAKVEQWKEQRNHIVANYYYLVQRVAETMHQKIAEVEEDALASMGVDGLYDAVDGFEPNLNIKFETYAVYRIRGSILDAIRREDWVPRLVRSRAKKIKENYEQLEAKLGRSPTDDEMADEMEIPVEEYRELVDSAALKSVQSLDATFASGRGREGDTNAIEDMSMMDCICDNRSAEPLDQMIADELTSKLFGKNFSKLELRIVEGYYFDGRSMKEIAEIEDLSESRVSQIHSDIMSRVREKIARNPEYFDEKIQALNRMREKAGASKDSKNARVVTLVKPAKVVRKGKRAKTCST